MIEVINFLSARAVEAKAQKEEAYQKYCDETSGPDKWNHKTRWQNACKRLRDLKIAIEVIKAEYEAKP